MDFSSNHQYGGGDDDRSLGSRAASSIGMASSAKAHNDESFMTNDQLNTATQDVSTAINNNNENLDVETTDDALTAEAENAVSKERQMLYKENAAKLQSILENIKNSTKDILREMDAYLQETEEVEKTFIRCRANTQKESQRMEQVEPDVIAATQRFVAQGQQLFGAGGSMSLMNMAALMNGADVGGTIFNSGTRNSVGAPPMMMATVTPRGNDCASMAGSSMAGSMT